MTEFEDVARLTDGPDPTGCGRGVPLPRPYDASAHADYHAGAGGRWPWGRWPWGLAALFAAGLVLATCAMPARAEPAQCPPLPDALAVMQADRGQRPVITGRTLHAPGYLVIVASPEGAWTMLLVSPGPMIACAVGHGDLLHRVPEGVPS